MFSHKSVPVNCWMKLWFLNYNLSISSCDKLVNIAIILVSNPLLRGHTENCRSKL